MSDDSEESSDISLNAYREESDHYLGNEAFLFAPSFLDLQNRQPLLCDPKNAKEVPVRLPNGERIPDPYSKTGYLMGPDPDHLARVAAAGQQLRATLRAILDVPSPAAGTAALGYLAASLYMNLRQGGTFDAQREPSPNGGYTQLQQFRNLANVNVGLFGEQSGLTEREIIWIAGWYALVRSSNAKPNQPYFLEPRNTFLIQHGYDIGASGSFGPLDTRQK